MAISSLPELVHASLRRIRTGLVPRERPSVWYVDCSTCSFFRSDFTLTGDQALRIASAHADATGHPTEARFLADVHHDTYRSDLDRR